MSFKVEMVTPQIVHLTFPSQREMCRTLLRFQEFYESPKFKGKVFTLKEFKEWYKTTRKGRFTYYSDWVGFNFPYDVLYRVENFPRLSAGEKEVIGLIGTVPKIPFYVIATCEGVRIDALPHELAHACYYVDGVYSRNITDLMWYLPASASKILPMIANLGYHPSVLYDEFQAILSEGVQTLLETIPEAKEVISENPELYERVSLGIKDERSYSINRQILRP